MKNRRILLADDSPTQRAQTARILIRFGFDIVPAANGEEALREIESEPPDAYVLDIVMPGMNGFELCRKIRTLPGQIRTPIVLLTSLSDTADVLKGLESGANSFVVKPCNTDYLPRLLESLIKRDSVRCEDADDGSIHLVYQKQGFVITPDHERMLTLLLSSFESAEELNKQLAEAHAKLSEQAGQLRQKVHAQASEIDQHIEERRQVESQLYHYQRMEAVDRLASAMAHDFNNMLMVIQGFTNFLLDNTDEDDKRYKYMTEIMKASRRAGELTDRLLIFSRKLEFTKEIFDLGQLIWDIHSMLASILGSTITLEIEEEKEGLLVQADKQQIEQVIVNLTTNARDAMAEGGRYSLRTTEYEVGDRSPESDEGVSPGRYIRLQVTDTGTGIPREVLEHIFEPFYTTKASGKGTGLGLSTVYGVIRKSGGYILCSSVIGQGTQFSIYLPIPEENNTMNTDEEVSDE